MALGFFLCRLCPCEAVEGRGESGPYLEESSWCGDTGTILFLQQGSHPLCKGRCGWSGMVSDASKAWGHADATQMARCAHVCTPQRGRT